jgi:sulfopyruvate decarboxylase alpha subunit
MTELAWQDELYEFLRSRDVSIFTYVPDAGHKVLIDRSIDDPDVQSIALTTEEEGVGVLAGAHLGGARGVLMMQSSGVGNCVNFFSLVKSGGFPIFTIVSMRGDHGEGNPWQMPMGEAVEPVLRAMGIRSMRVDHPQDVIATTAAAMTQTFQSCQSTAVLLTQKLLGAKAF